jgi:hypothetical protein
LPQSALKLSGWGAALFGMLDYRAHKLFRLLRFPLAIIFKLAVFAGIATSIIIAQNTSYTTVVKIVLAYVVFEVLTAVIGVVYSAVLWMFKRGFFWLIDVIPAHGSTPEEARAIAEGGRAVELGLKFERDIANWTPEDTYEFVSLMNWRARLFFGGKLRIRSQRTATELKRIFEDTGKTPNDLGITRVTEVRKQVPSGDVSWFETAIVSQNYFNSITAITLIVLVIAYAPQHGL